MDKKELDLLKKYGLVTDTHAKAENYKSIDDLINKGVITIPGVKERIEKLMEEKIEILRNETSKAIKEIMDPIKPIFDTSIELNPIEEKSIRKEDAVETVETKDDKTVEEESKDIEVKTVAENPVENPVEVITEDIEIVETETPKKTKKTKKSE